MWVWFLLILTTPRGGVVSLKRREKTEQSYLVGGLWIVQKKDDLIKGVKEYDKKNNI